MANKVKIKRSAVASKIPTITDLELGELAINTFDGKLFTRKDDGTASIIEIGSGGGGITYSLKTANYTAKDKDGILANTTAGSFTVTLPASPAIGASVVINDAADSFGTNNLIVARNGSTIETIADNLILDLSSVSVSFIYTGTTWQVYSLVVTSVPAGTYATGTGSASGTNTGDNAVNSLYSGLVSNATHTGDVTGSTTLTLATVNSNIGTWNSVTVNAKGLVTGGTLSNVSLTSQVTGTLPVTSGGTGTASLTSNNIILGNGTSPVQFIAPGTSGNVLASNGTTWVSITPPSSGVLTANLDADNFKIIDANLQRYTEVVTSVTPVSNTITLNLSSGNVFTVTLTVNSTLAFSSPPSTGVAMSITLITTQGTGGNFTLSYPVSVSFTDGVLPVLATDAGKRDVLTFLTVDGGTTYLGGQALANT
jgi:hypothetical protein